MRTGVLLEIEELLFDTLPLRASALQQALAAEGVIIDTPAVALAHSGRPVGVTLSHLAEGSTLDATGRYLVLRRASDLAGEAITQGAATLRTEIAAAIEVLASEFPVAVVTRASRTDAQRLLEMAGLDVYVGTVRSLADLRERDQHEAWLAARARLNVDRGVAFAPDPLLAGARRAGLVTVRAGGTHGDATEAPATLLAALDASHIMSLF
jgi:beta-phosphoglucomutase-like phosphatase (HAD superfamily)